MVHRMKRTIGVLIWCAGVLGAAHASADSADYPECIDLGKACSTARVSDGTCASGRCWTCDGDRATTYACLRCLSADEVAAAGAPSALPDAKPTCSKEDDSGCTVQQLGSERGIGALFLAIGLGAFLLGRRRR
jgi:MYXO-CTERM domain-containing protein